MIHAFARFASRAALACTLLLGSSACFAQGSSAQPQGEPGGMPEGYALVWSDEFDVEGYPDPLRWKYDTYRNRDGWWNDEQQYYSGPRLQNARVENGILILEAHREKLRSAEDWGGQSYTSARLITDDRQTWTYGFFEIRAKAACGRGTWPVIWTLSAPPNSTWPDDGEIDIMEYVGYEPNLMHGAVHTGAYNHTQGTQYGYSVPLDTACEEFHRYQLTWTPEAIWVGIDDVNYLHFVNDQRGNHATWPFDEPQYLLLTLAIGGSWGGREGIDDSIFPVQLQIDYVRVYQTDTQPTR